MSNNGSALSDFLNGIDEIITYLHVSEAVFRELIGQGMPCRYYNKRWYANKKNIDLWHAQWTAVRAKAPPIEDEITAVKQF